MKIKITSWPHWSIFKALSRKNYHPAPRDEEFSARLVCRLAVCVTILLIPFHFVFGQGKGDIKGRVIDGENGEALPGVNVIIQGTYYGAASDLDGNFTIANINPGVYTIQASIIGYKQVQNTGVKVTAGQTTTLNFKLESTVLAFGQEIVVIGERPLFNIEETASRRNITSAEIKAEVVENVKDIVANQVGVVQSDDEIHIRGGRSHENAYLLDGISVQDPLAGTGFGLQLSTDAIEEVEVITGGFDAEYGQAMSGIINVKTKEGADEYKGSLAYKRDHFGSFDASTPIVGTFSDKNRHSFNTDVTEFSLSGPEPFSQYVLPALGLNLPGELSFFGNLYMLISDTYTKRGATQLHSSTFHGTSFAPRQSNNWSGLAKLTWKIDPTHKLIISGNQSVSINQNTQSLQTNLEFVEPGPGYPYDYQNNLDNFNTFTHLNKNLALSWTHTLNPQTFYDLKLSRFFTHLRSDVNGKFWNLYEEPQDIVTQPIDYFYNDDSTIVSVFPGDGFWDFGDGFTWHDHYVEEYTLKFDLSRFSRSEAHKFKAGFETSFAEMQMIDIFSPWFGGLGLNNDIYKVRPAYGSMYAQDQIKFKGLIANLGVRFDYWFPGKFVEDAVNNPDIVTISEATRQQFKDETHSLFGRRWRGRVSPRLGISHPISDNQMLFFSYGHFSKRPKPQFVYAKLGENSAKSTFQKFGNPNLDYETTVAYEMGLRHKFTENDVFTITAYYKDIFDYVTTVNFSGSGRLSGRTFTTYLNLDYSRSRGIEVEYRKRAGSFLTGSISGTYSIATGKSSSPDDAFLVARGTLNEKPITEDFLIWDRPWQVSAVANLHVNKGKGPRLFGVKIPDDWNLNVRAFAQAGRRYTPQFFTGTTLLDGRPEYDDDLDQNGEPDDPYGKLGATWFWVDLSFEKYFKLIGLEYTFMFEVVNLLDRKNSQIINPITGRAYDLGDPTPTSWNDPFFPDTQAPLEPFPFNPARFLTQRNVRVGLSVRF
ncbi:TonB-dependent receptor [candidate division KSB1 bacterium]|nr:TonB-dependent receptor [candidate division KSB1 bacterium]